MNRILLPEVLRLGGDPTDEVWRWLVLAGPHGDSFSWSQTKSEPAGYVGLQQLREVIMERAGQDSEFRTRASAIARLALTSEYPPLVRRGLQVSAALGLIDAMPMVEKLTRHPNRKCAADARSCLFVLRHI